MLMAQVGDRIEGVKKPLLFARTGEKEGEALLNSLIPRTGAIEKH